MEFLRYINKNRFKTFMLFFVLIMLLLLLTRYRSENIDEAWSASFYYNYINKGIETDSVFLTLDGQSGVQYFGKTVATIYGSLLNVIGWTRFNISIISLVFVISSGILWFKSIKQIYKDTKFAYASLVLFIFLEPFVANINSARGEAFILFLTAASFYLFINKWYGLSMFAGLVALETHPIGFVFIFFNIAYLFVYKVNLSRREIFRGLIGIITGLLFYLALHFNSLNSIGTFLNSNTQTNWQNLLVQYFFQSNYHRHLFDFAILISCAFTYLYFRLYKRNFLLSLFLVFSILFLLFFPRPNINYVSVFSIGVVFLIAYTITRLNVWPYVLVLIIGILSIQYLFLIKTNWNNNFDYSISELQYIVPDDGLPVIGSSNEWFSFKDREYYASTMIDRFPEDLRQFYLVEENDFRSLDSATSNFKGYIVSCDLDRINSSIINNEEFNIYKVNCRQ